MTGNPRPKVTWNVRGTTIRDDNDKYQVTSEGLVIKNITQNDKGAYKCNARQLDEDIADFQDMIIQLLIEREYITGIWTIFYWNFYHESSFVVIQGTNVYFIQGNILH